MLYIIHLAIMYLESKNYVSRIRITDFRLFFFSSLRYMLITQQQQEKQNQKKKCVPNSIAGEFNYYSTEYIKFKTDKIRSIRCNFEL